MGIADTAEGISHAAGGCSAHSGAHRSDVNEERSVWRGSQEDNMRNVLDRFRKNEGGAAAFEYTLVAAILAVILLAAWPGFYDGFMASWIHSGTAIRTAIP
jgi:Flp pilus assembly pilin Flp